MPTSTVKEFGKLFWDLLAVLGVVSLTRLWVARSRGETSISVERPLS